MISFLAFLFGSAGLWLAAKKRWGWLLSGIGNIFWIIFGIMIGDVWFLVTSVIYFVIAISNYYRSK